MFAMSLEPQHPKLQQGELLLLQLVKTEAAQWNKLHSRIEFAIIFDHLEKDIDGEISKAHWPEEKRTWPYIIHGSSTIPTIPFSLEDLHLSCDYDGQTNPRYIDPEDEKIILQYLQFALAEPLVTLQSATYSGNAVKKYGADCMLQMIQNADRVFTHQNELEKMASKTKKLSNIIPTDIGKFDRSVRTQQLAEYLKEYYDYHCQICDTYLDSHYGFEDNAKHLYIDIIHINPLEEGGQDISSNMLVVCPNHARVIHTARPSFNYNTLTYEYPNGFKEKLVLTRHLKYGPF